MKMKIFHPTRFSLYMGIVLLLMLIAIFSLEAQTVQADPETAAIRNLSGFQGNTLPANDDWYTGIVPIGFTVNFFGNEHSTLYVNNNGNITFDTALSTYTPFDLTSTSREIIAPFFGDVDTRGAGSGLVTYGQDTVDGHIAFGVNWFDVGYFSSYVDKLNTFQLVLIDRSDVQPGDFDVEFNYEKIQWETGGASGGSGGLGGNSARVGYSNGTGETGTFFELPGSAVNGAFLDSNLVTGLIYNSFGNPVTGRYFFQVRNGQISVPHNPLILIPGVTGSKMENDPNEDGVYDEVWPNVDWLIPDPFDWSLLVLRLASNGIEPYRDDPEYTSVRVGDIIRTELGGLFDAYGSTVQYFTQTRGYIEGQDFFVCPYDWRKSVPEIADGTLSNTLDECINQALNANPEAIKVDLLAHSMGGLVARYYISDPNRAAKVENLVTLGTPYLGTPEIAMAVIDKFCFVQRWGICFTNEDTLSQLVTNFPSAYQISPSDAYFQVYGGGYIYRAWDQDENGSIDGRLNANESFAMLAQDNADLTQQSREYQATVGGWSNGGTNGVNVLMIIGSGLGTPNIIYERERAPWYNPWGSELYYELTSSGNGDGTVQLYSAMMKNPITGVDLSLNVPKVYFNLEHGELPKDTQVLQVAASIFESQIYSSLSARALAGSFSPNATGPSLEPIPLSGQQITVEGPAKIDITDSDGNHVGDVGGGVLEIGIPGASFYQNEEITTIFLPDDSLYEINILGQGNRTTDIRFHDIVSDTLVSVAVYENLSTTLTSLATLQFDPTVSDPGDIQVDLEGDGVYDQNIPATSILTPEESQDYEAPVTTIQITGTPTDLWYTGEIIVEMNAIDNSGGSGVAHIEYSLDGGVTWLSYSEPFVVNADQIHLIFAKATDRASNEETPLAHVGYTSIYLPEVTR